ncbi:hypothetical protein [Dyadobacter sp. NIV53]|nr:hypothetical protein [Dyadobacter sp. NIV53]
MKKNLIIAFLAITNISIAQKTDPIEKNWIIKCSGAGKALKMIISEMG